MTSGGEPLPKADLERYLRVLRSALIGSDTADPAVVVAAAESFLPAAHRAQVLQQWIDDHSELEPAARIRGTGGRRPWFADHDPTTGYHWRRLHEYLLTAMNRSETVVDSLDKETDRILEMLEDPRPGGPPFRVKGLVIGYVQSGKTANFSALAAKAFDAGYKVVIVLSGLHNSLRRQTQLRLEDELGLVATSPARPTVGLAADDQKIIGLTTAQRFGDFNQGTSDPNILGTVRTLLVMKKNASILRRLDSWLAPRTPLDTPVLIIDDEADQASINTGGNRPDDEGDEDPPTATGADLTAADIDPADGSGAVTLSRRTLELETDPSIINGLIRGLMDRMRRVAYVGYTATPFANVLITHDAHDRQVGGDLYPSDFIVSLPRPPGYVGAEILFGRGAVADDTADVVGVNVVRPIPDWEADSLLPRRGEQPPTSLPSTLEQALLDFVLAAAARDTRTGQRNAAAMLIHASQLTAQQANLARLVEDRVATLKRQWIYNMPAGAVRTQLRERWEQEFVPVTRAMRPGWEVGFEVIEPAIDALLRDLPVLQLHNRSTDELDYERTPLLRAVLIGGNKLSRGLTLEGLLVSYYVRRANAYDTLLQMGRWFGYREDYLDLTRLYTTTALADDFRDLATYEEELRQEVRLYEQLGKTPDDFGPRISTHPSMAITAGPRMGSARAVSYNYSATIQQTSAFELRNKAWLQHNLDATRRLFATLGDAAVESDGDTGRRKWCDVDWQLIYNFLDDYRTFGGSTRFVSRLVREYLHTQATRHDELTRWTVALRGLLAVDVKLGTEDLHLADGALTACIRRSREAASDTSIGTLVNPISRAGRGDEDIDLDDEQVAAARAQAASGQLSYPVALRQQRSPRHGLLVVYPISRYSGPVNGTDGQEEAGKQPLFRDAERDGVTVIGIAASFPASNTADKRSYVVGSAGPAPG
jgi:hypothetical protein